MSDSIAKRGFSVHPGVLTDAECDRLLESLDAGAASRGRAGIRHLMSEAAVEAVASDERLLVLARHALRGRAVPFRATLFEKSRKANWLVVWHQDTALPLREECVSPEWGPWSKKEGVVYAHAPAWALRRVVALRLHLDDSTADNGPLCVIPGSHRRGVLSDQEVVEISRSRPSHPCLVPRGGVLAMRPLLIHSSSKAQSDHPRRVLHIEYADTLKLRPGITLAVC